MAFPGIFRQLFENDGAGPKLRKDILPLDTAVYQQTFTASGNKPAPYEGYYLIELQSGGGGSGGAAGGSSNMVATSGGNSGQYILIVRRYAKGQIISYTIGAGGTYGAATATSAEAGGNGGDTTFDGVVATGGFGSYGKLLAGSGTVYPNLEPAPQAGANTGNRATSGYVGAGEIKSIISGAGGSSPFGTGGAFASAGGTTYASPGNNATGFGAGAGGAAVYGSYARGANGSQGCVRITFLGV